MAGKIKKEIDFIIQKRSNGNYILQNTTITRLILKGIVPSKYDENSYDDPVVLEKLQRTIKEYGW
ncbi:MAG TPA: hypothetical protein VHY08_07145 [Bacillota bacterium]|nr:hypothetical protein [Bacillota bacterium]